MFLNYFTLNQEAAEADRRNVYLFRQTAIDLLSKDKGSVLEKICTFVNPFSFHLVFEGNNITDAQFINLLERTYLILGRENYQSSLGRKIFFVSYPNTAGKIAIKFLSRLKSILGPKVYIAQVPYNDVQEFVSSVNVSVEKNEIDIERHFRNFITRMISQKTLIDHRGFYCIISENKVNLDRLNKVFAEQLHNVPDLLSVLKESSQQLGFLSEELGHAQKEESALLNTITFLKKEVKRHFNEQEMARRREQHARFQHNQRVEDIKKKYQKEYEGLPVLYKKIGGLLKLVFGKVEFGYFINKRQKQDFLDILRTLPEDKQVEIWYYYEYDILPGWYKKIGTRLNKSK